MKINQFLQVVSASLILSLGFSQKLPADAIVVSSSQENSSLTTETNTTQSSDLAGFFATTTSQSGENSNTECNQNNGDNAIYSTPEPTVISGLVLVTGLGIWSKRKMSGV